MAEMQFDASDTALIGLIAFSAAAMAGRGTFQAFDVAMSDQATIAGATVSVAYLGTALGYVITVFTNDIAIDPTTLRDQAKEELSQGYYLLLVASFGFLVAWPFVPEVQNFIQSEDLWGVLYIMVAVGGQIALGYLR